uniref:Uncharacterized protein n=1 Tax=Anguilla anguilla TaxID=7936 RepID=A0A0E9Q5R4_ANGAN
MYKLHYIGLNIQAKCVQYLKCNQNQFELLRAVVN